MRPKRQIQRKCYTLPDFDSDSSDGSIIWITNGIKRKTKEPITDSESPLKTNRDNIKINEPVISSETPLEVNQNTTQLNEPVIDSETPLKANQNTTELNEPVIDSKTPLKTNQSKIKLNELATDSENEEDREFREAKQKLEHIVRQKLIRASKKMATELTASLSEIKEHGEALMTVLVNSHNVSNEDIYVVLDKLNNNIMELARNTKELSSELLLKHEEIKDFEAGPFVL
jgi:hypothetical protein